MASFIVYGDASGQVTVKAPSVAGSNTITFPANTGTLITSAYTGAALPGQISWDTTVKTSGFTAVAYGGYFCNTTSGAFTVTLPATPTRGQFVVIVDYAGTSATNNITVNPNGSKINGSGANATIATNRAGITYTYIDSTQGWLPSSNVYGTFTQSYTASYLIVAGGGGGATSIGGGGGAGGYLTGTTILTSGTTYTAVVGGGGSGATSPSTLTATKGSNSTFTGLTTAIGGGYGGSGAISPTSGSPGGSGGGGGGGSPAGAAGSGTPGQGNNGGIGGSYTGGGGGAGGVGAAGTAGNTGGAGGAGSANSITGTPATYASGGGGGGDIVAPATAGGGSAGTTGTTPASAATANTGGGGGGCRNSTNTPACLGGNGGSGIVILSVSTANYTGKTTGSPTVTTSGSNTIIKWTSGSGTYTA